MGSRRSFLEKSVNIKVEGFEYQKLLTECVKRGIPMRNVRAESEIEMTLTIAGADLMEFSGLTKNRYRVVVLGESGYKPAVRQFLRRKSAVAGLLLFALVLFYQSAFVSEIRVYGYEKFTETEIRNSLRAAGLYEGCSKSVDLEQVKLHLYRDLDQVTWVGVKYVGNLAEVTIAEGSAAPKPVDRSKPCHIVADREGFVERTIAREGRAVTAPGDYVKQGDVLISGIVPIRNTTHSTAAALTERYVHAAGEVCIRVPRRLIFYQERYEVVKEPTGRQLFGLRLEIGGLKLDTAKLLYRYSNSVYVEKRLFRALRPIPAALCLVRIDEVEVSHREREPEAVAKETNRLIRQAVKEKIPENSQILNNSLKFSLGENIIEAAVMLETLEKIGVEEEIVIGNPTD
jgi:similar to stage IV sporulation protein